MKKSLYGKKVIEKLNEENLSLASITNLLFEEEESDMSDLFGDSKESDDKDSKDDSKDKETEEEKDEKDSEEKSEDKDEDDSEEESIKQAIKDRADEERLEYLEAKDAVAAERAPAESGRIESDLLNAESFNPYYMRKNSLKKFLFEDEEIEGEAADLLVDLESKSAQIPSIVSNCMNYIKYFDSKVNKAQIIYDIAVQGIIKSGGKNFMSELEDFDELFHKVYGETFPDEEKSPVKKYTANDNFKVAAGAVKSG